MSERKLPFVNPVILSLALSFLWAGTQAAGTQAAVPVSLPGAVPSVLAAGSEDGLPLKDVRVDANKQIVFVFSTTGAMPPSPRITELDSTRLVLDFQGVGLDGNIPLSDELTQRISRAVPGVKSVRYGMVLNSKVPILRFNFEVFEGSNFKARVAKQEDGAVTISLKDDWGSGTAQIAQALQSQNDDASSSAYDAYFQQFKAQKKETSTMGEEWGARKGSINELPGGKAVVKPITTKSAWITGMFRRGADKSTALAQAAKPVAQSAPPAAKPEPTETVAPVETPVTPAVTESEAQAPANLQTAPRAQASAPVESAAETPVRTETPALTGNAPAGDAVSMDATTPDTSLAPAAPLSAQQQEQQAVQQTEQQGDKSGWESAEKPVETPKPAVAAATVATPASNPRHVVQKPVAKPVTKPVTKVAVKPVALAADEMQEAPRQDAVEQPIEKAESNPEVNAAESSENPGENPRVKARRLFNKAVDDHLHGRLTEAIAGYKAALAINTELSDAHSNLGLAYNQQHNYASALSEFRKALAVNASDAITYNGIGAALRAEKDITGAIKQWETAVRLDPKLAVAHYNLGTAYESQGELDRALVSYDNAIKNDSRLGEAYYRMGLILQKRHRLDEAKEHFRKSLKLSGDSEYSKDARDRLALLDKKPLTK